MLSENEALKLAGFDETPYYFQSLIKKIYDSIGSCGECKHYNKDSECELTVYFTNGGYTNNYIEKDSDDYCKKFERKD